MLGARVREHLNIKRIAVDVTARFHNKIVMKDFANKHEVLITRATIV
jgi:hypothetical protein